MVNRYKKTLVVANGEPPHSTLLHSLLKTHSQLIAVDGGLFAILKSGLEPNLIIGDFDSIGEEIRKEFAHIPQIHTPNQDKSDLEKTLTYLFDAGTEEITVCGALGKRVDHTLNNMYLLCRYPGIVKFETDTEICFALTKSNTLRCQPGQTLSLIPLSSSVHKVFTHGLKWELQGEDLSKNFVSISNICLQSNVTLSFEEGDLIACMIRTEPLC